MTNHPDETNTPDLTNKPDMINKTDMTQIHPLQRPYNIRLVEYNRVKDRIFNGNDYTAIKDIQREFMNTIIKEGF